MPPGVYVLLLSVLVRVSAAFATMVSVSVALLLAGVGSTTVPGTSMRAVLTSVSVAPAGTLAVTVKVAVPPTGSDTRPLMAPLPLLGVGQLAPALAAQLQLEKLALVGSASVKLAPITGLGPLLPATTV